MRRSESVLVGLEERACALRNCFCELIHLSNFFSHLTLLRHCMGSKCSRVRWNSFYRDLRERARIGESSACQDWVRRLDWRKHFDHVSIARDSSMREKEVKFSGSSRLQFRGNDVIEKPRPWSIRFFRSFLPGRN